LEVRELAEEKTQELQETLEEAGYKGKIDTLNKATIVLDETEGELIFAGRTQRGFEVDYDPNMQWGCSPTETLQLSLGGCMAIDVVMFLRKMRATVDEFKMEIAGERRPTPPQYYTSIDIKMTITGKGLNERRVDRAIALSQDKYCSVYHTMRPDLKVNVSYEIVEG
jgi:putative redox protein